MTSLSPIPVGNMFTSIDLLTISEFAIQLPTIRISNDTFPMLHTPDPRSKIRISIGPQHLSFTMFKVIEEVAFVNSAIGPFVPDFVERVVLFVDLSASRMGFLWLNFGTPRTLLFLLPGGACSGRASRLARYRARCLAARAGCPGPAHFRRLRARRLAHWSCMTLRPWSSGQAFYHVPSAGGPLLPVLEARSAAESV
jgi:hypothetical protein